MSDLVQEILARRARYIREQEELSETITKAHARIEKVRQLVFSCEKLLEEEGHINFLITNPPYETKDDEETVRVNLDGNLNQLDIVLEVLRQAGSTGLLPSETAQVVLDAYPEMKKKAVYRALYTLKQKGRIKQVEGRHYFVA